MGLETLLVAIAEAKFQAVGSSLYETFDSNESSKDELKTLITRVRA